MSNKKNWDNTGAAPVAVIMLSLNEGHNMRAVLENLQGFANEVFLVDSFSSDDTIDIALEYGIHVVQNAFQSFGQQWNFALETMPVQSPWTMKMDPDERLSDELKSNIRAATSQNKYSGFIVPIRLWFMGRPLPATLELVRLWKSGKARFSDVNVNEHALIDGEIGHLEGNIEHHDSPHLHHWMEKQNKYTTAEAVAAFQNDTLSVNPSLFGDKLQRRMWLKKHYYRLPFRHLLMFFYCWCIMGGWRAGYRGYVWARLRAFVYQMIDYKTKEMQLSGNAYSLPKPIKGPPDKRVQTFDKGSEQ